MMKASISREGVGHLVGLLTDPREKISIYNLSNSIGHDAKSRSRQLLSSSVKR